MIKQRYSRASLAPKAALAVSAAVLLAGCGEVKNTITPPGYTANRITVALAGQPNAFYAGLYDAQALGLFKQTDLDVHIEVPAANEDAVSMVHESQVLLGISSEPNVLLHRNEDQPVVGVAAIVQVPLQTIRITTPPSGPSGGVGVGASRTATATTTTSARSSTRTGTSRTTTRNRTTTSPAPTTTTLADPGAPLWPARLQQLVSAPGHPNYDGLVIVARKGSIVNDAPLLRRFVQAVARGYRAARANPRQAIENLIAANPSLAPQRALETAMLRAALPEIFPPGLKVWGWQPESQWNAFGSWLTRNHLLSNPNAITDASTNELLPGQGV